MEIINFMKNQTGKRGVLTRIDFHVLVVGTMVSLLVFGIVSQITFVPGSRTWIGVGMFGVLPPLVFLTPMVVTRAMDRRKFGGEDHSYLIVNGVLVVLFAILCGLMVYSILPAASLRSL